MMKDLFFRVLIILPLAAVSVKAYSAIFYIDPVNGSANGDGSASQPWLTLERVLEDGLIESRSWERPYSANSGLVTKNAGAPVKAGDTLILMSGHHGQISVKWYVNESKIYIKAGAGQTPTVSQLHFQSSSNWRVSGLSISTLYGSLGEKALVYIESHGWNGPSSHITLDSNKIFSAKNVSSWTVNNWLNLAKSGVNSGADYTVVTNNEITNVDFGITIGADHSVVANNRVINFAGDGMRGLGDNLLFEYNVVANGFDVDDNHDDGFQSWSGGGDPVRNVTLRGNRFYSNLNHPNPSLLSTFQGIGCFDGIYDNWVIENNLVAVSHWHGISLYGAQNSKIINNTVVDDPSLTNDRMVPWIRLTEHKNGWFGTNNVVRNNIGKLASTSNGTTIDYNLDPGVEPDDHSAYDQFFVDRFHQNYRLKSGSPARNAGIKALAPLIDIEKKNRGGPIDAGAFETPLVLPFLLLLDE